MPQEKEPVCEPWYTEKMILGTLLLLGSLMAASLEMVEIAKWRYLLSTPPSSRLYTMTMDLFGMDVEDIDHWWNARPDAVKPWIAKALEGVLDVPQYEFSESMIVRYKQALRLSCWARPEDEIIGLLPGFGRNGAVKWPEDFGENLFIKPKGRTFEMYEEPEWNVMPKFGKEEALFNLPLFHVIPNRIMAPFLLSLPMKDRLEYLEEMPIMDIPISAMVGIHSQSEHLKQSIIIGKEQWLASTGFNIPPLSRKAIFHLLRAKPATLNCPMGKFFLQVSFAVDYCFELEMIRDSSPTRRKERLDNIKGMLQTLHRNLQIPINSIDPAADETYLGINDGDWRGITSENEEQDAFAHQFNEEIGTCNREARVKKEAIRLLTLFGVDPTEIQTQLTAELQAKVGQLNQQFFTFFRKPNMCSIQPLTPDPLETSSKILFKFVKVLALSDTVDLTLLHSSINPFAWNSHTLATLQGRPVPVQQAIEVNNPVVQLSDALKGQAATARSNALLQQLQQLFNSTERLFGIRLDRFDEMAGSFANCIDGFDGLVTMMNQEVDQVNAVIASRMSCQVTSKRDYPDNTSLFFNLTPGSVLQTPTILFTVDAFGIAQLGAFIQPSVLFGWLNDRWPEMEKNMWWNIRSVQGGALPNSALVIHHALSRIKNRIVPSLLTNLEFTNILNAMRQVYITGSIALAFRNKPVIRNHLYRILLEQGGFSYFRAGWSGSHARETGHAMIVHIVRETDNNGYLTTLYNSGSGTNQYHQRIIESTDKVRYSSFIRHRNVSIGMLEACGFFNAPEDATQPLDLIYGIVPFSNQQIDVDQDHLWFRSQISGTCAQTVLRLLIRDLLGNIPKARLVRFEVARELIQAFKQSQGEWLKYSSSLDYWSLFKKEFETHGSGKLVKQLLNTKTRQEFEWMLRVIEIYQNDIVGFDLIGNANNSNSSNNSSNNGNSSAYPPTPSTPLSAPTPFDYHPSPSTYPASPSMLHDEPIPSGIQLLSKGFLATAAEWKGFQVPGLNHFIEEHHIPSRLAILLKYTDLAVPANAQNALSFLINHFSASLEVLFDSGQLSLILWRSPIVGNLTGLELPHSTHWSTILLSAGYDYESHHIAPNALLLFDHLLTLATEHDLDMQQIKEMMFAPHPALQCTWFELLPAEIQAKLN